MHALLKLVGSALVWVSLAVAAVSASTLYIVPVADAAGDPEHFRALGAVEGEETDAIGPSGYLKIRVAAGPNVARDGAEAPLFPAGTELTPDVVARMIGDDASDPVVQRVKVAQFDHNRWSHFSWFIAAVAGMVAGGLLMRFFGKPARLAGEGGDTGSSPAFAIAATIEVVESVLAEATEQEDLGEALALVGDRLGELQQTHLAAFAEAREVLIGRLGLGGFARVMDRFAAAERQINRAWSAAADGRVGSVEHAPGLLGESLACLDEAHGHLAELSGMLKPDVDAKL
ncbi:MAG: hypothetical protein AAF235_07170 [Planctomycetota bacterium]